MRIRRAGRGFVVSAFVCLSALYLLCVPPALGQSAGTGAISGTVTDPSGRSVPNATVTATAAATGQARTATTGPAGDYKFSLLPPGNYQLKFSASGFKTSEVGPVTVNVTETATANQSLEVGAVSEQVTVTTEAELVQTESSTLGNTVSGNTIQALPMANGNYTEVLSLAAGATAGVDNATSLGKGTQDISANGVDPGSNNYQMDGVAVNNIANSGSSNDGTIYTGIPIPSPDAIAEFKIQTSTYDASYGRNPGANVNVVTKSGTNNFHGSAFEYFRNSILNADDFFYLKTPGHDHQVLDQNQFGGTVGGPVIKDKFFFFFSYRGTRSKNGVSAAGNADGIALPALPLTGQRTAANLGAALCAYNLPGFIFPDAQDVMCNGSNISPQGVKIMNLPGPTSSGFYIPSPQATPQFCHPNGPYFAPFIMAPIYQCNFSIPALYHENQYVANGDYVINSKHTLSTRYFYTLNPQNVFLGQMGGQLPGNPEDIVFGNQNAVLKLTSTLTNNFVNEARISFQRNTDNSSVSVPAGGTNQALGITPGTAGFPLPPDFITFINGFTAGPGLLPNFGPTNQWQAADQISWQHGRHSIRAGYEYEGTNWPLLDSGLEEGLMFSDDLNSILVGQPGFNQGCLFCVETIPGEAGITHFYEVHNQDAYVLDDWKVSSRLTLNIGLRWEYDGLISDNLGRVAQAWLNRMIPNSEVPTSFSPAQLASDAFPAAIQQYVVASNFPHFFGPSPAGVLVANNRNASQGHTPYSDFAPRFGFAWQPLHDSRLVVRAGVGIFYNRVGLDSVVHAFEQGEPFAYTYDYNVGGARWAAATIANPYPPLPFVPLASNPLIGFSPRYADTTTANSPVIDQVNSGLSAPFDEPNIHTPDVREYSLGIQYEFIHGWVLDLGFVGSTGINLNDYNHNHNQATLFSPCTPVGSKCGTDPYGLCQATVDGSAGPVCNTVNNAEFRVPYLGYEAAGLAGSDSDGYSLYNSLQVTVRHQFSHGLSMQAAYTWDKDLSDIFYSQSANINCALCLGQQYGRVSFDRPQRLSVSYSYDLPFGKGMTGVEGKLINGWNVSGVTIAQSGDPLTFESPNNGTAYGTSNDSYLTGSVTGYFCPGFNNGNIKNPGGTVKNLKTYFNYAGFCTAPLVPFGDPGNPALNIPAATGYGDSGTGSVLGPGQWNWDISILKNTQITERVKMQFRTDFYNAFNHPQFADPGGAAFGTVGFIDTVAGPAGPDAITHTNVNPRLIQFGLRFNF